MKNLILAAMAALTMSVAAANAQSLSHNAPPVQQGNNLNSLQNGGG